MLHTLNHRNKLIIFSAVILSILLFALDNMIVAPAIPMILSDIGGIQYLSYVFTAYILTQTITTPIYGKLSDIISRKKMMMLAIIIFIASSLLCGLAENIYQLIAARAIQGIGGGAIFVTAMSMIGEIFTIEERAKYQGYIGAMFGVASVTGPIVGAFITSNFSWRYIFLVNLPVGLVSLILLYIYLPNTINQDTKSKIDYIGSVLLTLFLAPFILMFSFIKATDVLNQYSIGLAAATVVFGFLFYKFEKSQPSPIFSHHLFTDREFIIPGAISFLNAIILFASTIYIQILLQKVVGLDIEHAGLLMSAMVLPMMFTSILSSRYVGKTRKYKNVVVVGTLVLFVSMVVFSILIRTGNLSPIAIGFSLIPIGLGMGTMTSVFNIIIQMVYGRERLGEVTGALQLVRGMGGVMGTAVLGFVYNIVAGETVDKGLTSMAVFAVFSFSCLVAAGAFAIALRMREKKVLA